MKKKGKNGEQFKNVNIGKGKKSKSTLVTGQHQIFYTSQRIFPVSVFVDFILVFTQTQNPNSKRKDVKQTTAVYTQSRCESGDRHLVSWKVWSFNEVYPNPASGRREGFGVDIPTSALFRGVFTITRGEDDTGHKGTKTV